jgi:riboflavin kinase / FMN adenylyltransferase
MTWAGRYGAGVEVLRGLDDCPRSVEGSAVTIGFFDGVHLGHQVVIGEVRRAAAELGARTAVVTFDPHPALIVRPESAPKLLTDLDQRLQLLAATGVETTLVVPFDEERSKEPPEDFVREVLVDCLAAKAVVVGSDFHFGHERRGNVALLQAMGRELGFEVDGIELLASAASDARVVSSTSIRNALAAGDVASVDRTLGRLYEVRGYVELGDQRGRELGFPTANLAVPADRALPADGVYAATYARADGSEHRSVVSVGNKPQFHDDGAPVVVEAHLLDGTFDLYGERGAIRFVQRLRAQERFPSVDDLVTQIGRDADEARRVLSA